MVKLLLCFGFQSFKIDSLKVPRFRLSPTPRDTILNIAVGLLYFLLSFAGLYFSDVNSSLFATFPAAGFSVAMIVLYGPKILPGVFLGALLLL